ncbi:carnitine O-palmitoyltransferase 1, liver isoform-like [Schistocerca nitens]|uniref:carnitine O-palmitoyltransferase 1, liver isoform-like n=1 Tax=Schistocerca nitens TaxID=7011 RepID=UPI0021175EC6|nr:carnitine O-palmitoyltransferase 1, liver isoform-like [Schistocerca nitens]
MSSTDSLGAPTTFLGDYHMKFIKRLTSSNLLRRPHFTILKNNLKCRIYPFSLRSAVAACAVTVALYMSDVGVIPQMVDGAVTHIERCHEDEVQLRTCKTLTSLMLGLVLWMMMAMSVRYSLSTLLVYKGWIYEREGGSKPSLPTKLWFALLKALTFKQRPMLCSYQGVLPKLPVPALRDTVQRYLRTVRPLYDDVHYALIEKLAYEFENGVGPKLQRYLMAKSWLSENYVSDWWEEYAYLRCRAPILINSNYYGIDLILANPTHVQSARAGMLIHRFMKSQKKILYQTQDPLLIQRVIPLCSSQYMQLFNTTRVPGEETDRLVHYEDSDHVVVYHQGRYFKLIVYCNGRILEPCEIEQQIIQILQDRSLPAIGEEKVAALTAGDRPHWSRIRQKFFSYGVNQQSLEDIETAAFFVALDDGPLEFDENDPRKLENFGRVGFHGKGYDRWFDKSITLVIGSNGHAGFNAEHTGADGAAMAQTWEYVLQAEVLTTRDKSYYRPDGHTAGTPKVVPPPPTRLQWDLEDCVDAIESSYQVACELISDLDLRILYHNAYGKGFIKQCGVSPDAYIQMALQLAYYRDVGKFTLTYETSTTRLYLKGRTETVRPCTMESVAWVKAMTDKNYPVEDKMSLLKAACAVHIKSCKDAMCGKGVDRHLFCLYILSKYLKTESPFLQEALSEPWRLSTSQTPHNQIGKADPRKIPNCITPAGGFGPTDKDGYGVSYIISGEDVLFFHVTSKRSSPVTDSTRFSNGIKTALTDMRNLFLQWKEINKEKKAFKT